jgi:hypothetical protein
MFVQEIIKWWRIQNELMISCSQVITMSDPQVYLIKFNKQKKSLIIVIFIEDILFGGKLSLFCKKKKKKLRRKKNWKNEKFQCNLYIIFHKKDCHFWEIKNLKTKKTQIYSSNEFHNITMIKFP